MSYIFFVTEKKKRKIGSGLDGGTAKVNSIAYCQG